MDIFSSIWDWLCGFLSDCLEFLVDFLPDSPFKLLDYTPIQPYLKYINWVIPLDFIVNVLSAWLICISTYYVWSVVLRWIKAID